MERCLIRIGQKLTDRVQLLFELGRKMSAKILIVDDEPAQQQLLKYNIEKAGYEILLADNGKDALILVEEVNPDLIILDWMIPEASGIDVCRELRSRSETRLLPILMLSARGEEGDRALGLDSGADDYITKPFNPGIVKTRVKNILENRKKLREYFLNKVRFEPDSKEVVEHDLDAQFIEKAISLVNANLLNEEFGIETMVDELCMSQSTLFRKIKSLTGLSITAFIRSVKLKKAAQLLLEVIFLILELLLLIQILMSLL